MVFQKPNPFPAMSIYEIMFTDPQDPRTADYVEGRFG